MRLAVVVDASAPGSERVASGGGHLVAVGRLVDGVVGDPAESRELAKHITVGRS